MTIIVNPTSSAAFLRRLRFRACDYLEQIVVREAHIPEPPAAQHTGQELIDACAKVRGMLTDDEVGTLFSRNPSAARPVDFE